MIVLYAYQLEDGQWYVYRYENDEVDMSFIIEDDNSLLYLTTPKL